jgi:hypothetical protein
MSPALKTPVALMLFNRPDETSRVFNAIAEARPKTLLLVADGPRDHVAGESTRCKEARALLDRIDWPCEVHKNFSETNLGCRRRISSGIDWVFQNVEEAIFLEDDCLPDFTFFRFCEELLEQYRDDDRVMTITGGNYLFGGLRVPHSYYFSRIAHIWGWATWKGRWDQLYDINVSGWPEFRDAGKLQEIFDDPGVARKWHNIFETLHAGKIDTWDYQLVFAALQHNKHVVVPGVNLIHNIGFTPDATHSVEEASPYAEMPTQPMKFPLSHPNAVRFNKRADRIDQNPFTPSTSLPVRLARKLQSLLKQPL